MSFDLPNYPWDTLAPLAATARAHADGIVDISIGTPVDATPLFIQQALADAADAHGYPTTVGTVALRQAIVDWFSRRRHVHSLDVDAVLPTVGSKELVALLPFFLGFEGGSVAFPHIAYPTYDMGARLNRMRPIPVDVERLAGEGEVAFDGADISDLKILWLNSPSNPTGAVLSAEQLRSIVQWARGRNIIVVNDECYAELSWLPEGADHVVSILDPEVCGEDTTGLLAAYSLSKQSNLAGYRSGILAGDKQLIQQLLLIRKHAGLMLPGSVQHAMTVALGDDAHVAAQRAVYAKRRDTLAAAVRASGGTIEHSEAGLYLWTTWGKPALETLAQLAQLGILAGPGHFYGEAGANHVRLAITATDERINAAAKRLLEAGTLH